MIKNNILNQNVKNICTIIEAVKSTRSIIFSVEEIKEETNGPHRSPEGLYLPLATVAFFKPKILVFILLQLRVGHIHTLSCSSFSFPKNFPRIVLNGFLYHDSYSLYITATQWPFYDFLKFCIILFFLFFY